MEKIIPIWQPVGYSTHIIAKKVSKKLGVKTSHTGTLDPMAEGVIIVLSGQERLKKKEYAKWPKVYEFDISFGISTDTFDSLGLIEELSFENISSLEITQQLNSLLPEFQGKYIQKVPPYSAIKVKGKPLHWYARNKKLNSIKLPEKEGTIFDIQLDDTREISTLDLINTQLEKISKVSGDLRQEKITNQWQEFLSNKKLPEKTLVAKIKVKISKGLYIRRLSQDICKQLGVPGFVSKLVRLQNGTYTKENFKTLSEVFGKRFRREYDFDSKF